MADIVGRKTAISIFGGTVTIEVICGDDYEAEVLYDDLIERIKSGQGFSLGINPGSTIMRVRDGRN